MTKSYDILIIGAGSVGIPAAMECAGHGLSVLVLDSLPSPGQGQNKKAIGGIRATHSDYGKVRVCQRSIEIFSEWHAQHGDDIHWQSNGYSFPAYTGEDERLLKDLMEVQHSFGLNIGWLTAEEYRELTPGIAVEGLRGSTFSPEDGSASPLLYMESAYFKAVERGAEFRFDEPVEGFIMEGDRIGAVRTRGGIYRAGAVLNAAGAYARDIARMAGLDVPVDPDCHEAAVSEPVQRFMGPMVVDMRRAPGSRNFYFYQEAKGHVIACLTPEPLLWGTDTRPTSAFLPMIARRMVGIMPMLASLKIRRTWRGLYPNTPDGFPIVGTAREPVNFHLAVGMCGQGFMLGPGLGELLYRLITGDLTGGDREVLKCFDPGRDFGSRQEAFK